MAEIEPLGLFTYAAMKAGWFFAWRMTVFTLPYWGGGVLVAAGLAYVDPGLAPIGALIAALGFLGAFIASIPLTNRIARAWALASFGRRLAGGVWWAIFWRVLVVSIVTGVVFAAVQVAATVYAATLEWSPTQMFVTMIPYAVLIANLVVTLRAYGWAMSVAVARRLGGSAIVHPASAAPAVVGSPPLRDPGSACPKCGSRELERGAVIARYCRVCGWREKR